MRLEIIKDNASPFNQVFSRPYTNGRRYQGDEMDRVAGDFLGSLELSPEDTRSLEIGAGPYQRPSRALKNHGVNTTTLDLDWNSFCTKIPRESLEVLGESKLYPMLSSESETQHYMGDICYIGDERSELRDKKFDLVFYWGSIYGASICSSIEDSERTRLGFKREISLKQRLESPIPNVSEKGLMAEISGFFNATGDPCIHPTNILLFGGYMIDTLLVWLNNEIRKPEEVIVFGLSKDRALEYMQEQLPNEFSNSISKDEMRDSLNKNRFEFMARNHYSIFSDHKKEDSSEYVRVLGALSPTHQRAISELGIIDCIAVKYND